MQQEQLDDEREENRSANDGDPFDDVRTGGAEKSFKATSAPTDRNFTDGIARIPVDLIGSGSHENPRFVGGNETTLLQVSAKNPPGGVRATRREGWIAADNLGIGSESHE